MIWFTSDTHYNHKNLVLGTTEWGKDPEKGEASIRQCRKFDTLESHNEAIIRNINRVVDKNDTLYCLGDWSFGGLKNILEFRNQVECLDIHLIFGNHDQHIESNREVTYNEKGLLKTDYEWLKASGGSVKSQSLFSSVQYYKELKVNGQYIILSHYAHRVWNKSHRGSWMLYGHSHGTLDEFRPEISNPTWIGDEYYIRNYRTMDVGMDTHPEFRPYSMTELVGIMQRREVGLEVDHHNSKTI